MSDMKAKERLGDGKEPAAQRGRGENSWSSDDTIGKPR